MTYKPSEDRRQIEASQEILDASAKETEPYNVEVCGLRFVVLPGVFSPKYFGSTHVFSPHIPYRPGEMFLEIGCGTGATSVIMALKGAGRVVAVDINPAAVDNTKANARLHGVAGLVEPRVSDIFSAIRPSERFNTIYWNMPWLFVDEGYTYKAMLDRALYDPGYRMTLTFLQEARHFLAPDGCVLVGFGDFGDIRALHHFCTDLGYDVTEITRGDGYEGGPVQFILYRLTPQTRGDK